MAQFFKLRKFMKTTEIILLKRGYIQFLTIEARKIVLFFSGTGGGDSGCINYGPNHDATLRKRKLSFV